MANQARNRPGGNQDAHHRSRARPQSGWGDTLRARQRSFWFSKRSNSALVSTSCWVRVVSVAQLYRIHGEFPAPPRRSGRDPPPMCLAVVRCGSSSARYRSEIGSSRRRYWPSTRILDQSSWPTWARPTTRTTTNLRGDIRRVTCNRALSWARSCATLTVRLRH